MRGCRTLMFAILYLLTITPVIAAIHYDVKFLEYVDEPSLRYHNLIVYDHVGIPFFVGRLFYYFNSTVHPLLPRSVSAYLLENALEQGRANVLRVLEDLDIKPFKILCIHRAIMILFYSDDYEWGVESLRAHAGEIGSAYAQALEAVLNGENIKIEDITVMAVKLPIGPSPYTENNSYANYLMEKINDEIVRLNGGKWPSWYYGTVVGIFPEIVLMRPGFEEEGVTLWEALDQVRTAVRKAAGRDLPMVVNIAESKVESRLLTIPNLSLISGLQMFLALLVPIITAVIMIVVLVKKLKH